MTEDRQDTPKTDTDDFKECATCAAKPGAPTLCESCLHNRRVIFILKDKANLFDLIAAEPSFITFYTGENGQGASLRETVRIDRHHMDKILYRMAQSKGQKLGACSWLVFKPIGMPHNINWYNEDQRIQQLNQQPLRAEVPMSKEISNA